MAVTRPELGPTLPGALRERFRIPPAVTLAVAGAIGVAAVTAILIALTGPPGKGEKVVHDGAPVFNMLHPPDKLPQAKARAGELMRFEARRAGLAVSVVVRPLELPHFDGDVTHGLLPVYADRFVDEEKRAMPGLELVQEGRARVNNAVGYEVGYVRIEAALIDNACHYLAPADEPPPEAPLRDMTVAHAIHIVGMRGRRRRD